MKLRCLTTLVAGLCLLGAAVLPSCKSNGKTNSQRRATLRPDHLHCYGYQHVETPTLDRLAQRGVLFEQAVAQTPLTPPSHASIFTGQYPTVHHVRNTGGFILQSSSR